MTWSRIFPNGDEATPNEEGLAFMIKSLTYAVLMGLNRLSL